MVGDPETTPGTGSCPSVADLLADANAVCADLRTDPTLAWCADDRLVAMAFTDWEMVAATDGRPPTFGKPRALLRHRTGPWWLLMWANTPIRLLPGREWASWQDFEFSTDPVTGNTYKVGTADDIITHTVDRHARSWWSTDVLLWLLDLIPGDRADAERLLLGFWMR